MPRKAKQKSESGVYRIIVRNINRQSIFENEEDKEKCDTKHMRIPWWITMYIFY